MDIENAAQQPEVLAEGLGRRKFVKTLALLVGIAATAEALAACGDTATSAPAAPATTAPAAPATTAPAATTASATTAPAATTAAAATTTSASGSSSAAPAGFDLVGPAANFKANGDPVSFTSNGAKGFVYNTGSQIVAYSSKCTHKGCDVPYVAADQKLECPCHGSQYDKAGQVIKGPAPKSLPAYQVQVVGDNVYVKVGQ